MKTKLHMLFFSETSCAQCKKLTDAKQNGSVSSEQNNSLPLYWCKTLEMRETFRSICQEIQYQKLPKHPLNLVSFNSESI